MIRCNEYLKKLTSKNKVAFTKRGNASINASLKYAKSLGYKKLLIQDQGGWITYPQFAKKLKFELTRLKTDFGVVNPKSLNNFKDSVLLINSMSGYAFLQNMKKIYKVCKKNNIFLINDAAGSIGTKQAKFGDIIIGSFGRWKPVNLQEGGFIATNINTDFFNEFSFELDFLALSEKLSILKYKLKLFNTINNRIKKELSDFEITHKKKKGINVFVKFHDDSEKKKLIKYCENNCFEYVLCPKEIRVLDSAISIEVKRLDN
ncbi:MAG: DegT/DnrJ/EryC1/StrS family aminotransferase [Nanoarchaeota archaeon]|nr:DegT/DnrJ/EryC1/StrS family aminotransferase [Nanoarchaeota archaeon]MBU1029922.1 DegT/DnrJ/EryC1/StrS family aminotransferase [Nanoarchaeota archaeon]MBU1850516.1 DegT/DnrJ/EryC1/StrS family aminotransferase [Nanoarchaeota archaeon]